MSDEPESGVEAGSPGEPAATAAAGAGPAGELDEAGAAADPPDAASLLSLVDRLGAVLEHSELSELEVEVGGTTIVLRRPAAITAPVAAAVAPAGTAAPAPASFPAGGRAAGEAPAAAARPAVRAPLTGIWYGSPAPGSAPFTEAGREVAVGQVIGLIEAMKLFNEIKSDLAGRVVRVVPENGTLVKAKQPLIEVEPL